MRCLLRFFAIATLSALSASAATTASLRDAFAGCFAIGVAIRDPAREIADPAAQRLLDTQFNALTPENLLKWGVVQPTPGRFVFDPADRFVAFGESRGMRIIGHTLVWHHQTPPWIFQGTDGTRADRATVRARLREHIHTVVGRYKGRIHGWDVVNEAVADNTGLLRRSPWFESLGEDYLVDAYTFAHEADPKAELYYNDYGFEAPVKRRGVLALVRKLRERGVPLTAVGLQGHYGLEHPSLQAIEDTIRELAALGVKVMITELDVNVLPNPKGEVGADVGIRYASDPKWNPYREGLPEAVQQLLARRYAALFEVFVRHADVIDRVTFWNVHDGTSWLNNWPIRGRTNHPLLFDRAGQPKPAFAAVLGTARKSPAATPRTVLPISP